MKRFSFQSTHPRAMPERESAGDYVFPIYENNRWIGNFRHDFRGEEARALVFGKDEYVPDDFTMSVPDKNADGQVVYRKEISDSGQEFLARLAASTAAVSDTPSAVQNVLGGFFNKLNKNK
ncbi:MAG: hypothetical protein ACKVOE_04045 [Rickettsiales bacterium]